MSGGAGSRAGVGGAAVQWGPMHQGHMQPPMQRETRMKTLPSHNFIDRT